MGLSRGSDSESEGMNSAMEDTVITLVSHDVSLQALSSLTVDQETGSGERRAESL